MIGGRDVTPFGFSPTPLLAFTGLVILVGFAHWTLRRVERGQPPLFSLGTFGDANYRAGIATDALESLLIAGLLFIVPVFLQSGRGYTALEAGVALLPFSLGILIAALGLPRLGQVVSPKLLIQLGAVMIGLGLVWYRSVSAEHLHSSRPHRTVRRDRPRHRCAPLPGGQRDVVRCDR